MYICIQLTWFFLCKWRIVLTSRTYVYAHTLQMSYMYFTNVSDSPLLKSINLSEERAWRRLSAPASVACSACIADFRRLWLCFWEFLFVQMYYAMLFCVAMVIITKISTAHASIWPVERVRMTKAATIIMMKATDINCIFMPPSVRLLCSITLHLCSKEDVLKWGTKGDSSVCLRIKTHTCAHTMYSHTHCVYV